MNKPAPKEPSMDEILSSIRQIIADDDAAVAPRKPPMPAAAAASLQPAAAPRPMPAIATRREPEPAEPLALTAEQMLRDDRSDAPAPALSYDDVVDGEGDAVEVEMEVAPQLVDPEDIAFESDDVPSALDVEEPEPEPVMAPAPPRPRPAPSPARVAPMPDPTLSEDMAEKLLEPTTDAAVKHTFARLNGYSMAGSGMTLDALMREMLRPMLKEWLDENLPALVERMVEKEISRISRGE